VKLVDAIFVGAIGNALQRLPVLSP